jgi:GGDEF domain-containing protein
MGKTVPYVFLALSIAFFLFLVGLTGYRIETTRRSNVAEASKLSGELLAAAKALRDVNGSFESPFFKSKMKEIFSAQPRLLVVTIYTADDGILYLIARNVSYLAEPGEVTPEWRGKPSYRSSPGFETLFTLSYPLATPDGERTVIMDSLFVVFGREDLYPVLRDNLYLLLSFLIVCGIFILIAANVQDNGVERAGGTPAPKANPAPGALPDEYPPLVSLESGLARTEHFVPRLKNEIERAASSDEDVSVACIEIDGPVTDRLPASSAKAVSEALLEAFPIHDLVFESGKKAYAVILPDSDIDRSFRSLDELRLRISRSPIDGRILTISVGLSARAGRLINDVTLHQEAVVSLQKAQREGGNRVVGFRASPSKFRQVLSGIGEQGIPS